jgi:hypothetical protein
LPCLRRTVVIVNVNGSRKDAVKQAG